MALSVNIQKQVGSFRLDTAFETDGEILALLGASGCGKSMTLKCIAGIETPDAGRIVLDGRVLFDSEAGIDLSPQARRVGYLFQEYALFPNMTVEENIMTGVRNGTKAQKRTIAREKIRSFRLDGLGQSRPAQLSGGQKQRVALARILVNEPEVLLLDEPFTALDSNLKWELELELADTLKEFNRTVVFVSHSREEVYRLCQSVCVLTDGRSEDKTTVRALFDRPHTVSAARITGFRNISAAVRSGPREIFAAAWGITLACDQAVPFAQGFVGLRGSDLRPVAPGTAGAFAGTVQRVIQDIGGTIVLLKTPGGGILRLELDRTGGSAVAGGQTIELMVAPDRVVLLTGR